MPDTVRDLVFTPRFRRALKRYAGKDSRRRRCVDETLMRMAAKISDPELQTHTLTGPLEGLLASSCGYDCRIVFYFSPNPKTRKEEIVLTNVGTHDEVY